VALLAVFQPDARALARISSALGGKHELVEYSDWGTFHEALDKLPSDGCLIDPYRAGGSIDLGDIQRLRERHPSLAIIVYADFKGHEMDLYTLGRYQIDGVVPAGKSQSDLDVRETISEALASSVAARVGASLGRSLSPTALDGLKWAIEHSHRRPKVKDLAEALSHSTRSLAGALRKSGAPSPGRLLLWGKLFRAVHVLSDGHNTVEEVAYALGYSSGAALSRALRRETGHPPGEIQRRGGIGCLLDAFTRKEMRSTAARSGHRWRPVPPDSATRPPLGRWS
jgi:AraC-like DNA-binding protein